MAKKSTKSTKSKGKVKARTKAEVYGALAESNEMTRKQVGLLFDDLAGMIKKDLGRSGP